jgi:peptidoglycan/LPS O-acetylase OafA/YrhL
MNLETMSKQRKMMLITAAVGIISVFLPWFSYYGFSVSGMSGWGILVFLCFAAAGVIAYKGDQTKNLNQSDWTIALIVGGIAALVMVINFLTHMEIMQLYSFGFYLALIASVALLAVTYMNRSATDNLQAGFDNLKTSFGSRDTHHTGHTTTTSTTITPTNVSHTPTDDTTRPTT